MLIKCQPSSLWTSAWMQRLRGDRSFTVQYIYSKHLTILYTCTPERKIALSDTALPLYYVVHLQSVMFNTLQEILFYLFFNEILKFIFCCNHLFQKCLIYFCFGQSLPRTAFDTLDTTVSQGSLWFQSKPACCISVCSSTKEWCFLFLFFISEVKLSIISKGRRKSLPNVEKCMTLCVVSCSFLSC